MKFTMQGALTKVGAVATNNVGTTKQLTVPKVALSGDTAIKSYDFSGIQNEKITLPRFYNVPKITPSANYTGQIYPMAVTKQVNVTGEVSNEETTGARLNMFVSGILTSLSFLVLVGTMIQREICLRVALTWLLQAAHQLI